MNTDCMNTDCISSARQLISPIAAPLDAQCSHKEDW
jgi:hypothetical protein